MKNFNWGLLVVLLFGVVMVIWLCILLSGCAQVVINVPDGTEVKINTFLKTVDFDRVIYGEFLLEKYRGESPDVEVYAPAGIIKTKGVK